MGTDQNTLQVDANQGTMMIVLIEEEELKEDGGLGPDLVLLVKQCWNKALKDGVWACGKRDRLMQRPGGGRKHSL